MSLRRARALREHHLEAAFYLRIARALERGQRGVVFKELFALQRCLAADLPGLAQQRPAAQHVLLQDQLDVLGDFTGDGALLQQEAHRTAIVAAQRTRLAASSGKSCFDHRFRNIGDDVGMAKFLPQDQAQATGDGLLVQPHARDQGLGR